MYIIRKSSKQINVGLFIPTTGDAGIWGPSCRSCAELAAEEINKSGGINEAQIVLHIYDAGGNPEATVQVANQLIDHGKIDVIVGMHTSDVREAMIRTINKRIPYIYTPLWEGGSLSGQTLCIGETPDQQLAPSLMWLSNRYRLKKWYLVGHDYVWPRVNHHWVKQIFKNQQQEIVAEKYLSFEVEDFSEIIDDIERKKPCAILLSLVGDGSVHFNRQFGKSGLSSNVVRLSTAVEENMLLGIGEANSEGLFASAGYFACLDTRLNGDFLERYHTRFGEYSPPLNAIGHSVYEGIRLLKPVLGESSSRDSKIPLPSVRKGNVKFRESSRTSALYLAEVQGLKFNIVERFANFSG